MCSEWETLEHSSLNETSMSKLRSLCRREGRKIFKARNGQWLQGNSDFQTQQGWCTHELAETGSMLKTHLNSNQEKSHQGEGDVGTKSHPYPRSYLYLMACWERESWFSINVLILGISPICASLVMFKSSWPTQNTLDVFIMWFLLLFGGFVFLIFILFSLLFVCLLGFLFPLERKNMKLGALSEGGRLWEHLGYRKEYDKDILYEKIKITKKYQNKKYELKASHKHSYALFHTQTRNLLSFN